MYIFYFLGITSKLDYLVGLGVKAAYISSIYQSPMKDFGYDISDFKNIDPLFGTLEDYKKMATAFREKGLDFEIQIRNFKGSVKFSIFS